MYENQRMIVSWKFGYYVCFIIKFCTFVALLTLNSKRYDKVRYSSNEKSSEERRGEVLSAGCTDYSGYAGLKVKKFDFTTLW